MTDGKARIALVVAAAENGVIGKGGGLPWKLSSDLKFFRRITMGKPVVMGRKTLDSIGKPLDGRDNIVITRNRDFGAQGVTVAADVTEALNIAREKARSSGAEEICVIGGAQIYELTLPLADVIYLTEVHARPDGDAHFPELDRTRWREVARERHEPGPRDSAPFSFVMLERVNAPRTP